MIVYDDNDDEYANGSVDTNEQVEKEFMSSFVLFHSLVTIANALNTGKWWL